MSRKLLLADDSVTIQKVIEITLSDKDYILSIASDGDEAMRMATSERPDLIMADVFMPGKDGYEVCEAIRSNADLKDVPVLLLAGTFEPFDQDKARAVGANDWIVKPFSSQGLIDKVEELLAQTPVEEQWQATPSQAPGDQDILQALEEVVATQKVALAPVADPFVEPVQAFEAPAATAVELEPLDFSVAEPVAEEVETRVRSVDPFASPEPATDELPPLDGFSLPEEVEPVAAIPEAVESFSFDDPQEVEAAAVVEPAVPKPVVQTDFDLPPLGDFNLPEEQLEPEPEQEQEQEQEVVSDVAVIDLKEADIAEEGAYGAVPERVEKRIAFLSDEQLMEIVERVAGAVIERLAAPMLEQVVWEVVPDLAESMVREEMAKIKPDA